MLFNMQTQPTQYLDLALDKSSVEIKRETIGLSKQMEQHRLELADIVSKNNYLWDYSKNLADHIGLHDLTKKKIRNLPTETIYNGKKVVMYFVKLERKMYDKSRSNGNKSVHKLDGVIDAIHHTRNSICCLNTRLIDMVLNYKGIKERNDGYQDFYSEGYFGLSNAAHKFDYKFGNSFAALAVNDIDSAIDRAIKKNITIHIPDKTQDIIYEIGNRLYTGAMCNKPRSEIIEELSRLFGMTEEEIEEYALIYAVRNTVCLDAPLKTNDGEDDDLTLEKLLIGEDGRKSIDRIAEAEASKKIIDRFVSKLDERSKIIFKRRFLDYQEDEKENTLKRVGEPLRLSRERIRQIESGIKKQLTLFLNNSECNIV